MTYFQSYFDRIWSAGNLELATTIRKTVEDVVPKYISNFSFTEHVVSLLVGDIQSGKTSHMFGLMCAAADEGFMNFILLTLIMSCSKNRLLNVQSEICVTSAFVMNPII